MPELKDVSVTLRMEGSDMLIQALNDHIATIEIAKQLLADRDRLQTELDDMKRSRGDLK